MKIKYAVIAVLFASAGLGSSAVLLSTIATTGYNQDLVYETGLAPAATTGINANFGSRAFYESTAYPTGAGLTRLGNTMTTAAGNTVNFDFQAFNGNNALLVPTGGATLTF